MADRPVGRLLHLPTATARTEGPGDGDGAGRGDGAGDGAPWAELHAHSSLSFLQGASEPSALVAEALRLGVEVLALTDRDGLYGARRLAEAADGTALRTVYGAELTLTDHGLGRPVVLARSMEGFQRLSAAITAAQLAGTKGNPVYDLDVLARAANSEHWAVLTGCPVVDDPGEDIGDLTDVSRIARRLDALGEVFGSGTVHAELIDHRLPVDTPRNDAMFVAARRTGSGIVASGAVHYATPAQARLAQSLTALRRVETLDQAAGHLMAAPTAHLRGGAEMEERLARYAGVFADTVELGRSCVLNLAELRPELPVFPVPSGHDDDSWLRELAGRGCTRKYGPRGAPAAAKAWQQLDHELAVITERRMAGYFLTVHDIVDFARRRNIWCQGRGSAASSVVCFVLDITAVDALRHGLLFERFLSMEKSGPPDIDIDFENHRREEVIQYVYDRYGRDHAAQVANLITYRPKLAVRDAARVLGYPAAAVNAMTRSLHHRPARPHGTGDAPDDGPDPDIPADVVALAAQLRGLPRHLGVHSGGMVLTARPIGTFMPVEWATMPGRSVLQGDKEDVAAAGLVKIDLLGVGMLAALHSAADLIAEHHGRQVDMATIPQDDPAVYAMIARADTIGVYQAESRAQISTLPQLEPTCFEDLAVAASIIRPGPIQAGSKHPYLRRRAGEEPVTYPHPSAEAALKKSLGVVLWQEQAIRLAVDCAGFTPGEADRLRKDLTAKDSTEKVARLRGRLLEGMARNEIGPDAAERIVTMIESLSSYGFPESHAQSMAGIIYASAWFKLYYPAALIAGIMAHLPMGFYDSQTLIQDARHHGISVLGVDINASAVHARLEDDLAGPARGPAIRRGLTSVHGLSEDAAAALLAARADRPFQDLDDVARRGGLDARLLEQLATAGAFGCLGTGRREAIWRAGAHVRHRQLVLPGLDALPEAPDLPAMTPGETTLADLIATGATAGPHPVHHLRGYLGRHGAEPVAAVRTRPARRRIRVGGIVKYLQRPPTANGMAFAVVEDETAMANLVFTPPVWARVRRTILDAPAVLLDGHIEREYDVTNLIVHTAHPLQVTPPQDEADRAASRDL
ncbi:error-prone DNA polymerase, DnaE-like [Actinacidiphila alni]|uniref:Error-prone DNA polymerase n=1 Tax=Actinacidiphila alni TaxID=380248 RepID=A0A1I2HVN6_9ACTN|nr:error-prone DNA polymerase [Actinacidiphila alni]SFF32797.1 error-prone DNA polymerase, DnaE-like [Actinacidiphila alni]